MELDVKYLLKNSDIQKAFKEVRKLHPKWEDAEIISELVDNCPYRMIDGNRLLICRLLAENPKISNRFYPPVREAVRRVLNNPGKSLRHLTWKGTMEWKRKLIDEYLPSRPKEYRVNVENPNDPNSISKAAEKLLHKICTECKEERMVVDRVCNNLYPQCTDDIEIVGCMPLDLNSIVCLYEDKRCPGILFDYTSELHR